MLLQKIRDKTTGWIASLVLGLLVLVMAFFGIEQYAIRDNATYAARVSAPPTWWPSAPHWWPASMLWQSREISAEAFRAQFDQARQQQLASAGANFDAVAFESIDNKRKLLDQMIDREALLLNAQRHGVVLDDAAVRKAIEAIPAFQVDGRFNANQYQIALASQFPPQTPVQFQQQVREDLEQALIPSAIMDSAFVGNPELDRWMALLGETRDVSLVLLPPPAPDTAPVSDAEIQAWYEAHKARLMAPETVNVEYVLVDAATTPAAPSDDATLRARYEQEKSRFVQPEQRLVSHILVKLDANATPAQVQAAKARAEALATEARKPGADFAAIARASSDDVGSKASGGDLGWIAKGSMPKAFDDAVFAMQAGQIGAPVRSDFGWHVIDLRQIKPGAQVSFEQARPQLLAEQEKSDGERAFNDRVGKLVDAIYKNPTELAAAAQGVGLQVQQLTGMTRADGTGIAAYPQVRKNAFSESMIQDGTASDPIKLSPTQTVVLRVTGHTAAHALTLAQARERVIAAIHAERAEKALQAEADALVKAVQGGQTLSAAAAARSLAASTVNGVPRGAAVPTPAANQAYFAVPAPTAGKVAAGAAAMPDGSMLVYAVSKVTPGDLARATPQDRDALRAQLQQMRGFEAATGYVRALRKQLKIEVAESRL
jgi:peptidyl-prolyl cis-trans isomerase D